MKIKTNPKKEEIEIKFTLKELFFLIKNRKIILDKKSINAVFNTLINNVSSWESFQAKKD